MHASSHVRSCGTHTAVVFDLPSGLRILRNTSTFHNPLSGCISEATSGWFVFKRLKANNGQLLLLIRPRRTGSLYTASWVPTGSK